MRRLLIISMLLLAAPAALAQPREDPVVQAKKYFEAGKQAYESGQYLAAATAFEQAYLLTPLPPIAFSMAQAYRKRYFEDRDPAKLKRAVELYRSYLKEVKSGGRRDDALSNLADLEPMLARIEEQARAAGKGPIEAPPVLKNATQLMVSSRTRGAVAIIDGGEAGEVPLVKEVTPGKHKIRVEAPGYFPDEVEGLAVEGQFVVVDVNLREKPARLALRTEDGAEISIDGRPVATTPVSSIDVPAGKHFITVAKRGRYAYTRELTLKRGEEAKLVAPLETTTQRKAAWWVLGGAGALLVGGGVTTVLAFKAESDAQAYLDRIDAGMNITAEERAAYERLRGRRDDMVMASYVLYGSAVVVGVTGFLLYLVDTPRVEAPTRGSSVVPVATGDSLGAAWVGTF